MKTGAKLLIESLQREGVDTIVRLPWRLSAADL